MDDKGRFARFLMGTTILAVAAFSLVWPSAMSEASSPRPHIVKLYEGGQVVGRWESSDVPVANHGMLMFHVRDGVSRDRIVVHGTFSAVPK